MGQVGDEPRAHRIADARHHDGNLPRSRPRRVHGRRARRHDQVHAEADQLAREDGHAIAPTLRKPPLDGDVPALDVAELAQALAEGINEGLIALAHPGKAQHADARDRRQRLRSGRERPDHRQDSESEQDERLRHGGSERTERTRRLQPWRRKSPFSRHITRKSSWPMPSACRRSTKRRYPSAGMGLWACPPSEEMTKRSAPMVLRQWAIVAASVKAQLGVIEQKTNSTVTPGRARDCTCSSVRPGALSYGCVRMSFRKPWAWASATSASISSKETWPVATAAPRSLASAMTSLASGMRWPAWRRLRPSDCVSSPLDCAAKPPPKPKARRWQAASSVGIQTMRAPSASAASTARGLTPPT